MRKRLPILLLLCLFCSLVFAQEDPRTETINKLYGETMAAYKEKDFDTYKKSLLALNEVLTDNATVYYHLAKSYALTGEKAKAVETLRLVLPLNANIKPQEDADFEGLKGDKEFQHIVKKLSNWQEKETNSSIFKTLKETDLHAESIAYDKKTGDFYISSIHKRKIVRLAKDGTISDFISSAQDGIWAVSGIKIDSKRRVLWATTSVCAQMKTGYEEAQEGKSAVFKYDLDTKKCLQKYFAPVEDEQKHFFGDVELAKNGDVYLSDSYAPVIYKIEAGKNELTELVSKVEGWRSLQGLSLSDDEKTLFVADYTSSIFKIELATHQVSRFAYPKGQAFKGIDGLYFYKNSLIAIQNGVKPMRSMRYFLDKKQSKVVKSEVIDHKHPSFDEPTLGVLVGKYFYYIANSSWGKYDKENQLAPAEELPEIVILKVKL